jgi:hypothetical protein
MIRIQISKRSYVELLNQELQKQAQYTPCMQVRAVPPHINARGYVLSNETATAKSELEFAIAEVEKRYWQEIN